MGNEHVTDKQLKNSVFTAFGVMQAIGRTQDFKNIYSAGFPAEFFCSINISCYLGHNIVQVGRDFIMEVLLCVM